MPQRRPMHALVLAFALSDVPADRVFGLLGTWSCVSAVGSHGTMSFAFTGAEEIAMVDTFTGPRGAAGKFVDTYRFDDASASWHWSSDSRTTAPSSLSDSGTAPPWTGETWTLDGSEISRGTPVGALTVLRRPLRLAYRFTSPKTFERLFQRKIAGAWTTTSISTCTAQEP